MGFREFNPNVAGDKRAAVKAVLNRRQKADAKLTISVCTDLAERLGWHAKTPLVAMLGTGEDHGRLKLAPDRDKGAVVPVWRKYMGGAVRVEVRLGHVKCFVNEKRALSVCAHGVEGDWLVITLPAWRLETAPTKTESHKAAIAAARECVPAGQWT